MRYEADLALPHPPTPQSDAAWHAIDGSRGATWAQTMREPRDAIAHRT